ncbi:MAG: hypothetical protein GY927_20100 [bacterium]|nr:hypothetical protein [bacterium]
MLVKMQWRGYPINKHLDGYMHQMNANRKYTQSSFLILLATFVISLSAVPGWASDREASLEIRKKKGFSRLVFEFDQLPEYSSNTISTVFVLKFKKSVAVDLGDVVAKLPNVLTIARSDPDGFGLRFAMVRDFKVNVLQAGNHLVVDFLSKNWRGRPPSIPQDIVDKLAKVAETARLALAEQVRQEASQTDPLLVDVRYAEQPTFHRISFNWNRFVTAQFTRKGNDVIILFGGRAIPDLALLKNNPPANLKRIKHVIGPKSLKVIMEVVKGTKVRAFREGQNYVVDLTINKPVKLSKIERKLYAAIAPNNTGDGKKKMEEISLPAENGVSVIPPAQQKKSPVRAKEQRAQTKKISPLQPARSKQDIKKANEQAKLKTGPVKRDTAQGLATVSQNPLIVANSSTEVPEKLPGTVLIDGASGAGSLVREKAQEVSVSPFTKPGAKTPVSGNGSIAPIKTVPRGSLNPLEKQAAAKLDKTPAPKMSSNEIDIERNENSVRLRFPFEKKKVAAAIFQRNETLWVLLDSSKKIDLTGLKARLGGIVNDIRHSFREKSQLFEFQLSGPWLSSVSQRKTNWSISIGDLVTGSSKKLEPAKRVNSAGVEEVYIATALKGRLHQIKDRLSGDDLLVRTSTGPAKSIKKIYDHVDFQLFQTIHGIVVRPLSDSLRVTNSDQGLKISGVDGLYLSGDLEKVISEAEKPHNKRLIQAHKLIFNSANSRDLGKFIGRTLDLEKKIVSNSGRAQRRARLDLAQHWLSRGLAPEALGMLAITASEDEDILKDPVFRLLRGMSNVLLKRYKKAEEDLKTNDLKNNKHASLWRGVVAYKLKNFDRSLAEMKSGEPLIKSYLPNHQAMFRLVGADVAIEKKNPILAGSELDNMPKKGVTPLQGAMSQFLEGRLMELQNRPREALQLYADATKADIRPVTAKAVLHLTDLRLRSGELKSDAGIDILERLSIVWRGDDIELEVLYRLADLHLAKGRYNEAFALMKAAVKAFPRSPRALALQDRMKSQFQDLFLQDKADSLPPIKALALFYDHKHLTPPGRLGDEMIRRLADRLIKVDLLDKAAGLLEHQVSRRLKGAGRAQVAIRLAMVYLLQHHPKKALKTLYQSRQPKLPTQVREARRLLEARAYAELGRSGPAMELLAGDDSSEAGEIKSLALWNGKKWNQAGEQYEKLLGVQWQMPGELPAKARMQILRSAISYTLGGDQIGVGRLRDKYGEKMSRGVDAEAFAMIADPLESNASAVGHLARDIADINTLEAFIKAFGQRLKQTGDPQQPVR